MLTRNPLYLLIIGLSAWLAYLTAGQRAPHAQSWHGLIRLGGLVWLITIPFNALMIHSGKYVLFRLPISWPLLGGNITLEAILHGAASGFAIWMLLLVFAAFNTAVDASQLLRMVPPSFFQVGVVASIALTFVPRMLTNVKEIREAQRVRGHRFRSWRDILPLIIPLITTSLEDAVQLAESMESRGFGGQASALRHREQLVLRLLTFGGLALLLSGLGLSTIWRRGSLAGGLLVGAATALLLLVFIISGSHIKRSLYRRSRWSRLDTLITAVNVAILLTVLWVRMGDKLALVYYPYPPYSMAPAFDPLLGSVLVLLAVPGLMPLLTGQRAPRQTESVPSGELS